MSTNEMVAPELASIEIKGMTRHAFMLRSTVAAGAVYGLSTVGPFVGRALAQDGGGDVDILNYALTLEYLEAAFYEMALKEVQFSGGNKKLVETLGKDEKEHVDALTATIKDLKGKPVAAPGVDFGKAFASEKSFLKLSQTVEDLGVSAYNGAAPQIKSKEVLGAAGSIVQVEARHAAAIRLLNGESPTIGAFDKPLDMPAVLEAVKPFIK